MFFRGPVIKAACFFCIYLGSSILSASVLPAAADVGRIKPTASLEALDEQMLLPVYNPSTPAVELSGVSSGIEFRLDSIVIEGSTIFGQPELSKLCAPFLGRQGTLATLEKIASEVSDLYREKGYFLSRAYVPSQEVSGGVAKIIVVEGYIPVVNIPEKFGSRRVIAALIKELTSQRPLRTKQLESFLLRLNGLSSVRFAATLEPLTGGGTGEVQLVVVPKAIRSEGVMTFDNLGSNFLGPFQMGGYYATSFAPLRQTMFSALTSVPANELQYVAVRHLWPLASRLEGELTASYGWSRPGATLKPVEIDSRSVELGAGLRYKPIRQRNCNLSFGLEVNAKTVSGDMIGDTPLVRENMRVVRLTAKYDIVDEWNGYNFIFVGMNRGLNVFGASHRDEEYLSREEAAPNFWSVNASYARKQLLLNRFMASAQFSGQFATKPLYSSEEFGYGGQNFGKAYDPSEITGDCGVASAFELRYAGTKTALGFSYSPYVFYDAGQVWNRDSDRQKEFASSAGLGMQVSYGSSLSSNLGIAFPLTHERSSTYSNPKGPRFYMGLTWSL